MTQFFSHVNLQAFRIDITFLDIGRYRWMKKLRKSTCATSKIDIYTKLAERERDAHVSCCRRMWLRVIDPVAAESGGDVCGTVESRSDAITSSTKSAARGDEVSERDTRYGFGCRRRASSVAVAAATPPSVRRRIACTECDVGGRLFACSAAGECFARRRSCSAESPRRRRRRRALTGLTPPSDADRRRAANFRRRTAVIGAPVAANYARRRR